MDERVFKAFLPERPAREEEKGPRPRLLESRPSAPQPPLMASPNAWITGLEDRQIEATKGPGPEPLEDPPAEQDNPNKAVIPPPPLSPRPRVHTAQWGD